VKKDGCGAVRARGHVFFEALNAENYTYVQLRCVFMTQERWRNSSLLRHVEGASGGGSTDLNHHKRLQKASVPYVVIAPTSNFRGFVFCRRERLVPPSMHNRVPTPLRTVRGRLISVDSGGSDPGTFLKKWHQKRRSDTLDAFFDHAYAFFCY
jgi:hypothetical protein